MANSPSLTPAELAEICAKLADEKFGSDIIAFEVGELTGITDYFVLCTAGSEPQLRAIADHIERRLRSDYQLHPNAIEGTPASEWVIMDFGTVIVHLMTPASRERYGLESLWSDAPRLEAVKILADRANDHPGTTPLY